MSTTALASTVAHTSPRPNRIRQVMKLHFVNPWTVIGTPWAVMGAVLVLNLAVWGIILASLGPADRADATDGFSYSGGTLYIFVYMLIVAIQAINRTFPFALGFGVTRRDFYLGTSLTFLGLSVVYGAVFTLLSYIEDWTHGWWIGGRLFTSVYFDHGAWYSRLFVFIALFLVFFFIGMACATVFVRWKATGLLVLGGAVAIAALGAVALATLGEHWSTIGAWVLDAGTTGVLAVTLIPTAVFAVIGFFVLRRATPKS